MYLIPVLVSAAPLGAFATLGGSRCQIPNILPYISGKTNIYYEETGAVWGYRRVGQLRRMMMTSSGPSRLVAVRGLMEVKENKDSLVRLGKSQGEEIVGRNAWFTSGTISPD